MARQFELQQGSKDPEKLKENPNAGKKVILFSDSRQGAARIAKDLTDASDKNLTSKILVIAAHELQEWAENTGGRATLKRLYPAFLKVLHDRKVSVFSGESKGLLKAVLLILKRNSMTMSTVQNTLALHPKPIWNICFPVYAIAIARYLIPLLPG